MLLTTYYRIENLAGGVDSGERALIRAMRSLLTDDAKALANRDARHNLIRELLNMNDKALDEYYRVMRGQYLVQLDNQIGGE
jgi:hypothetical protein